MFNPAYVLPTFLGVCCAGLVIWNVRMTGDLDKLDKKLETALDDNDEYEKLVRSQYTHNLELDKDIAALRLSAHQKDTTIRGYQQDVDTLREERRIQEQKIENCLAAEAEYIQTILDLNTKLKDSHAISNGTFNTLMAEVRGYQDKNGDLESEVASMSIANEIMASDNAKFLSKIVDLEKTVKDFTGMINTLNNKIPNRDESGKFKKKK